MSEYIEKARPDVAASKREMEQRNTGEAFSVSGSDFIMDGRGKQSIIDYLPHNRGSAVTAAQLGEQLSISTRDVTRAVQAYRLLGVPICASCGEPPGYFIADDPEPLAQYIKSLEGRSREMSATLKSLIDAHDAMTVQQKIKDF